MNDIKPIPPPGGYYPLSSQGYSEYSPLPLQEEKEVHLRDYWKVIQKRRWIVIAFFLIVLIVTAVGTFTMEPVYRGTATIQINKENPQIVDFKEVFAVNTMDMDYYQTQYKILESRTLARRVVKTLKLSEHPEFQPKPETTFEQWKSNLWGSLSGIFGSPSMEVLRGRGGSLPDQPFPGRIEDRAHPEFAAGQNPFRFELAPPVRPGLQQFGRRLHSAEPGGPFCIDGAGERVAGQAARGPEGEGREGG